MVRLSLVKRSIKSLVIFASLALLANVIFYLLGFGQAPLVVLDEDIEYYLKPQTSYKRFGNNISVNRYGMRSLDFDREKEQPFYAVIGDSVVYGQHTLDQTQTLAFLLNSQLKRELQDESIIVGSIAASSWGPGNMLAYYERFGPFIGNTAFLVLSSHDRSDIPFMTRRLTPYRVEEPISALLDFLQSAVERIEDKIRGDVKELSFKKRLSLSEASLNSLVELLKRDYTKVILVFHATKKESLSGSSNGEIYYRNIAEKHIIEFFSTRNFYKKLYSKGVKPHGDNIHLTWEGNKQLSEKLLELIN